MYHISHLLPDSSVIRPSTPCSFILISCIPFPSISFFGGGCIFRIPQHVCSYHSRMLPFFIIRTVAVEFRQHHTSLYGQSMDVRCSQLLIPVIQVYIIQSSQGQAILPSSITSSPQTSSPSHSHCQPAQQSPHPPGFHSSHPSSYSPSHSSASAQTLHWRHPTDFRCPSPLSSWPLSPAGSERRLLSGR